MNTPSAESQAEISVKGSKFLAYLRPVADAEAIAQALTELRRAHPKARHHCYAFRLGIRGEPQRAADDGEPSGSAGLPILNQLRAFEVSDALLVVVRYFGGTLLGVPGLIRAYKQSSEGALNAARLIPLVPQTTLYAEFPYPAWNELMQAVSRWKMNIVQHRAGLPCQMVLSCRAQDAEKILAEFARSVVVLRRG